MDINIVVTNPKYTPVRANPTDAGADLKNAEDGYILQPGERKLFKTGVKIAMPVGTYGRIAPRSGLAYKHGIDVLAGVIDEGYRNEIGVILLNTSKEPFTVGNGDRIAQLITEKCDYSTFSVVSDLNKTIRGAGGFGSTGLGASPISAPVSGLDKMTASNWKS